LHSQPRSERADTHVRALWLAAICPVDDTHDDSNQLSPEAIIAYKFATLWRSHDPVVGTHAVNLGRELVR
jgi:hypothetical protein